MRAVAFALVLWAALAVAFPTGSERVSSPTQGVVSAASVRSTAPWALAPANKTSKQTLPCKGICPDRAPGFKYGDACTTDVAPSCGGCDFCDGIAPTEPARPCFGECPWMATLQGVDNVCTNENTAAECSGCADCSKGTHYTQAGHQKPY